MNLSGKHVLFVAPKFFSYDTDILDEIRRRGAVVDRLRDRPFDSAAMVAIAKLSRPTTLPITDRIYARQLSGFGRSHYDVIFVVNGQTLSRKTIKTWKANFPHAKMILYVWDAIANRKSLLDVVDLYDEVHTFDPLDAELYGLKFRPTFFTKGYEQNQVEVPIYDLSFVGTVHSDRMKIIHDLNDALPPDVRRYWYCYLQARWVYSIYKATKPGFRRTKISNLQFKPLPRHDFERVFRQSRAILDIEHPQQRGLTMRAFESLAASKKFVTTNAEITQYDFYRSENVLVLDRKKATISREFLCSSTVEVDAKIKRRYSIEGWLDDILNTAATADKTA